MSTETKNLLFADMHRAQRGFVMPNAWDAGSARIMAEAGFAAIGTTSAGIAFSLGRPDFDIRDAKAALSRDDMFARVRQIVEAVSVPVNVDLEDGYGSSPETVADTVALAIAGGLAGGNIEDNDPRGEGLYPEALAVERIRAAKAAIARSGRSFMLTAKSDAFLTGETDPLATAIRRSNLFLAAGADCVFPCGAKDIGTVKTLLAEIDGPVNIVLGWNSLEASVPMLLDLGVARISLGGTIARSALGFVRRSALELRQTGTIGFAAQQIPQGELNALFSSGGG